MLDIETLRFIWWALLGILLIGFAVTDGFDMGVAVLLPLVAKDETERRIVLNTIGPVWEGNQVWIILGAGAIFAAWPFVYATAFSGFYLLILLLLLTMGISRPVSFKYRSKLPNLFWRRFWDRVVFIGGLVPALIFGILMGNALSGVPFYLDDSLRLFYSGLLSSLFNPFALWCGVTSLTMLTMHGGLYLAIKTENEVERRALFWAKIMALLTMFFFIVGGVWVAFYLPGYQIVSGADHFAPSNPLHKQVVSEVGAWMQNYHAYPLTWLIPLTGIASTFAVFVSASWRYLRFAFIWSGIAIASIITTVGASMFPFILPSSTNLTSSLTVWDASSSQLTLLVMLFSVIIFLPIILLYTSWVYRVLAGKISRDMIEKDSTHTAY